MKSPKLYKVLNFNLKEIIEENFMIIGDNQYIKNHLKYTSDNQEFRQIRLITNTNDKMNKYIAFVEFDGGTKADDLKSIVRNGFRFNDQEFVLSERSGSMSRTGKLSFVDKTIAQELDKRISMDNRIDKTVVSKLSAYRGLMLTGCHMLENYMPKIIITKGLDKTIKNVKIKCLHDRQDSFENENGEIVEYTKKVIEEETRDIEIDCFDGMGIVHPLVVEEIAKELELPKDINTMIVRACYMKGCIHKVDYTKFFVDHGVEWIEDVWGVKHSVYEPMIIMDKSMYKGFNYFKYYNDYRDWEYYLSKLEEYDHVFGIAKYNFNERDEKIYTKANYQILQDLDLPFEDFEKLGDKTLKYFQKIIDGDETYVKTFLGICGDKYKLSSNYIKAIVKNPQMLKQEGVVNHVINLLKGNINDAKCGKLYLKGCFKFAVPDLILFMEHIGGLEPKGCLGFQEFWTRGKCGYDVGKEYLITRNPHICSSEHDVVTYRSNELIEKYLSHLQNVCMIDCNSPHMARLNGCDFDGDLLFVLDEPTMIKGVDMSIPVTIDVQDKITVEPDYYNIDNIEKLIINNSSNRIGEYSNYSSCYHNKMKKTSKTKKIHDDYISTLSIFVGKEVDASKTGVRFNLPKAIAKYARPIPYFMKYRSPYYATLKDFNKYRSNMNAMCFKIENWERKIKYTRTYDDFDYTIMIDNNIEDNQDIFDKIEKIYLEFVNLSKNLIIEQRSLNTYGDNRIKQVKDKNNLTIKEIKNLQKYEKAKEYIQDNYLNVNKKFAKEYQVDWAYYYEDYKNKLLKITNNKKLIVNCIVKLCYEKYPKKSKKILWAVVGDWLPNNIEQVNHSIPCLDDNGEIEILGERYSLKEIKSEV